MGSGCIHPRFLDLGTSWRWVVSFTPRSLYLQRKCPRYPLDRRLGGPQSRSGRHGEVKILAPTGTQTPTPLSSSPLPDAIPTTLSRLSRSSLLSAIIEVYPRVDSYVSRVKRAALLTPWPYRDKRLSSSENVSKILQDYTASYPTSSFLNSYKILRHDFGGGGGRFDM
jgi:hypothetical protein